MVLLTDTSFAVGSLRLTSYARPAKLFTAHRNLRVAHILVLYRSEVFDQIIEAAISILRASLTIIGSLNRKY